MAAEVVAAHYNGLRTCGFGARRASPIFRLRNFNNWVKSTAIRSACAGAGVASGCRALDMCCGRGGDLFKWRAADAAVLVCVDLAEESVAECERKYRSLGAERRMRAGFVAADCADPRRPIAGLHPLLASNTFHVVSCQFALHYSFESVSRARAMLTNAVNALKPGGVLVGTLPDADEIMRRVRKSRASGGDGSFGNAVYSVKPRFDPDAPPPLFGAKYDFHLEGAVDCPEFLVHFPTLQRLAERLGLELVERSNFADFFRDNRDKSADLLTKMESLESLTRRDADREGYEHAKEHFEKSPAAQVIGTLSKEEWEAATMYCTFLFRKKPPPEQTETSKGTKRSHGDSTSSKRSRDESTTAKRSRNDNTSAKGRHDEDKTAERSHDEDKTAERSHDEDKTAERSHDEDTTVERSHDEDTTVEHSHDQDKTAERSHERSTTPERGPKSHRRNKSEEKEVDDE